MTTPELVAAMEEIGQQRNWALGRCAEFAAAVTKVRADLAEKDARIEALETELTELRRAGGCPPSRGSADGNKDMKGGTDGAAGTDD